MGCDRGGVCVVSCGDGGDVGVGWYPCPTKSSSKCDLLLNATNAGLTAGTFFSPSLSLSFLCLCFPSVQIAVFFFFSGGAQARGKENNDKCFFSEETMKKKFPLQTRPRNGDDQRAFTAWDARGSCACRSSRII